MKKQLQIEALLFILLGAAVGLFLSYGQTKEAASPVTISARASEPASNAAAATPTAATTSQISSDGTKKVVMNTTENKDGTRTYEISTEDEAMDEEGKVIFAKILERDEYLTIPFNTWSANNTYFFLEEQTKTGTNILVFQADGKPFADGEVSIDVTGLFANSSRRAAEDIFDEATGWAESNLLIINTKLAEGTQGLPAGRQGASYWVEIPSKTIYRLSTKF